MSGVWVASYVALWAAVAVLLVMVLALVRQIGVLHARLDDVVVGEGGGVGAGAGAGAFDGDSALGDGAVALDGAGVGAGGGAGSAGGSAGGAGGAGSAGGGARRGASAVGEPLSAAEGPPLGSPAPMGGRIGFQRAPLTLVAFTSASCELSQVLVPALRVVDKQYDDVRVVELVLGPRTIAAFEAFNVLHTPFVVAVGQDGRVRGRGRARNLQQLEAFVERALAVAAKAAARASAAAGGAGAAGAVAVADAGADSPTGAASTVSGTPDSTRSTEAEVVTLDLSDPPTPADPIDGAADPASDAEAALAPADDPEADPARAGV